jgi:hypothetical protein
MPSFKLFLRRSMPESCLYKGWKDLMGCSLGQTGVAWPCCGEDTRFPPISREGGTAGGGSPVKVVRVRSGVGDVPGCVLLLRSLRDRPGSGLAPTQPRRTWLDTALPV